jgi:hypothetical protein
MGSVISQLESKGIAVDTAEAYLLDSPDHKIRVPCTLDGVPVQISFSASMPAWSERIRAHLQVCFAGARRWSIYEGRGGFQISRIVKRLTKDLKSSKQAEDERLEKLRKRRLAEQRLAELSAAIAVTPHDALTLTKDNIEIAALVDCPSQVQVTVRTSHANAARIVGEFGKVPSSRKKA